MSGVGPSLNFSRSLVLHSLAVRTLLVAFSLVLAGLLIPRAAGAAMMFHHDLTSLALDADAIVRGHVVGERRQDEWTTFKVIAVDRSYKGPLAAGARIELSYDLYSMRPFAEGWGGQPDAGPPAVLGTDLVFFLRRHKPAPYEVARLVEAGVDPKADRWFILSSGLRTFLNGKAQRFEQWNNPGGFVPVPQGRDPYDLYGDPRGGEPLDSAGLDREIASALQRANELLTALDSADGPSRRRRLVELAGPPPEDASRGTTLFGFYSNSASKRIVEALAKTGDIAVTLEALARASGVATFGLRHEFSPVAVLDAAANAKLPLSSRLAAIGLADGLWSQLRETPSADARVIALMADAEPLVRAASVSLRPTEKATAAMKAAIKARFAIEQDERVRLALFHAADSRDMRTDLQSPPSKMPIVVVTRTRDVVNVAWADLDTRTNWMVADSSSIVVHQGGNRLVETFFGADTSYSNGASGSLRTRIAGAKVSGNVEVELVLEDLNKHRGRIARRVPLGLFTPASAAEAPAAASGAAVTGASHPPEQPAGDASVPRPTVPRRSGCACTTAGTSTEGPAPAPIVAALLALLRRRRGHRV